jgi:hypothetical protein
MTSDRNSTIIRLSQSGVRQVDIARQFNISRHRVHQIVEQATRVDARRAELEGKYGAKPNTVALPDATPIEVLALCDGRINGWAGRVGRIEAVHTLGDLRRVADAELLKKRNIGKKMLAELRRLCPQRDPGYAGKAIQKGHAIVEVETPEDLTSPRRSSFLRCGARPQLADDLSQVYALLRR